MMVETTERGGYPVLEHLRLITGGPVVWAPAVDGAVVVSLRGGDFEIQARFSAVPGSRLVSIDTGLAMRVGSDRGALERTPTGIRLASRARLLGGAVSAELLL